MERSEAEALLAERARLREARDFAGADGVRDRLHRGGWAVVDGPEGSRLEAIELPPAPRSVTMLTIVHGWPADARRWLDGVRAHTASDFEALVVDNSGDPEVAAWLAGEAAADSRVRTLRLDPPEGWAQAANRGIEAAAGHLVILFDPGMELTGDVTQPLLRAFSDHGVAVVGASGVRSEDVVGRFQESDGPEVEAVEGYCMAFRRDDALALGGFDRKFQMYRLADFELSYRLRDRRGVGKALVIPDLPLVRHEHRLWEAMDPEERERASKRNFYRLLDLWGKRVDLIVDR